jgi:thymidine phosphorylase
MDAATIIAALRAGDGLGPDQARWFANGLADGAVSDAQAGAFAMAICLKGLSAADRVALTCAMRDSGQRLSWDLPGPVVDKHSTGGVGDCVSLILAPVLAACGAFVPMISGRGLGHTGGTLDKMESISGVSTMVDLDQLRAMTRQIGCAIVGANDQIAPADRRLYAIRDVTATVESIDLITASILSKKLAAGLDGLILDVKCGSGAFMKTPAAARALAQALVDTAKGAGCAAQALITDMDAPLAPALGNAVEVAVCMEVLAGQHAAAPRLYDLTLALAAQALIQQGLDPAQATDKVTNALASGAAMECFARMIAAMGGPPDMAEDWRTHLPRAPVQHVVTAPQTGVIAAIDGTALGQAVVALGGGRRIETDRIDPAVGMSDLCGIGTALVAGDRVCTIHAGSDDAAQQAQAAVLRAIGFAAQAPDMPPLIMERIA